MTDDQFTDGKTVKEVRQYFRIEWPAEWLVKDIRERVMISSKMLSKYGMN